MRPRFCILAAALATALTSTPTEAQPFTGTFSVDTNDGGRMVVTLREGRDGSVAGRVTSAQLDMAVEGTVEGDALVGVLRGIDGSLYFEAARYDNELWLTLYGVGPGGEPDYGDFQEVGLYLEGTEPTAGAPDGNPLGRAGANPLAAAGSDPYVGTFTDGNVTLQLQGGGGQYQGRVAVSGEVYPVSASGAADGLRGLIQAPDGSFEMSVAPAGGGVTVVSGGMRYDLRREGATTEPAGGVGQPEAQPAPGQPGAASGGGRTGTGPSLAQGFTEDHPMVREWVGFLAGKKLTRMSSYSSGLSGGYSARTDLYLCSNRQFALRDESSVSVDVGGAFGNTGGVEGEQGTWLVITNGQVVGLILRHNTGEVTELRMDYQNEETYANGDRVYVTPAEVCS